MEEINEVVTITETDTEENAQIIENEKKEKS